MSGQEERYMWRMRYDNNQSDKSNINAEYLQNFHSGVLPRSNLNEHIVRCELQLKCSLYIDIVCISKLGWIDFKLFPTMCDL